MSEEAKVVWIHQRGNKCVVSPGHIFVVPDDVVEFRNMANGKVTVMIPHASVPGTKKQIIDLDKGKRGQIKIMDGPLTAAWKKAGKRKSLTKAQRNSHWAQYGVPGEFPYAVYCHEVKDFAEGGTAPVMLIDDPRRP